MKKIYRPLIKGTNWALKGLLFLLGFSGIVTSCEVKTEYGSPHAKYTVKGKVTDEDGKPIRNIGISILGGYQAQNILTGESGEFDITTETFSSDQLFVVAEDIDGEENGLFKSDTVEVIFDKSDYYQKGKSWYKGAARKEIPAIVLKEVEPEKTDE